MNGIRWGLCCKFYELPVKFKTATAFHLEKIGDERQISLRLNEIVSHNLDALADAVRYCANSEIGSFRVGSDLLPLYTHPRIAYRLEELPDASLISKKFYEVKALAESENIRLTFHPDQFVVLNSPREEVVVNSITELEYHGTIAELLGADIINIHGGGVYGDKAESLKRFEKHFLRLSERVRSRLTVENDDRCFTPEDLLPVCENLGIPLTYDVHHHRCLPDGLTVEEASKAAYSGWTREPLFHISSPKDGWAGPKPTRHRDFIDVRDFPKCWLSLGNLTIDVEAKAKEVAVAKLREDLSNGEF